MEGVSGEYLYTGGWLILHSDGSCSTNMMDLFDKKRLKLRMALTLLASSVSAMRKNVNKR